MQEKALQQVPYVIQSCEIPVSDPSSQSQYHVSVRVKTEEKRMEAYKNSELLCYFFLLLVAGSWTGAWLGKWG